MTNKEHIEKYKEYEKLGKFNEDINPVDPDSCLPVTKDFEYIPKSNLKKFSNWLKRAFIVSPYTWHLNKIVRKTKVFGRENLKGLKSAIVTCNHFYIFDCLAIKHALKGHKLKFCVAEYNNKKGFLGDMMRAQGILPLSKNTGVLRYFSNAVEHYLLNDNYVVFYPEQAMWYMYEKPRPFKNGAFHYAVKFNVPIIPLFITFRSSGKFEKDGLERKYFTVNIMPPIYPREDLSKAENIEYMKNKNFELCKEIYEKTYGKKLKYGENL